MYHGAVEYDSADGSACDDEIICSFAMMEAVLLLATMVQRFHLKLVPGHAVAPWPSVTLRPRHGIKVVLAER